MTCTDTKPTTKQRNYLIKLATNKHTSLTDKNMCCTRHASQTITRLKRQ